MFIFNKLRNKGFTLIEVVLVLALGALVTGFVVLSFSKVNATEALDKNTDLVVSVLNEARTMTLSAIGDTRYGVHFDSNQVVRFQGTSYATTTSSNVQSTINTQVGIRNIALNGGGTNVAFDRLTGGTTQSGTIQIYLKSATTTYKTVTVSVTGLIERN